MPGSHTKKKRYSERSDIEKIQSNWTKIQGLIEREEWSSAVVRAATVTEIAVNLVVRTELSLEKELTDHFLRWANGIMGKFDKLILPLTKGKAQHGAFKDLKKYVLKINEQRNSVVHQGQFKKRDTAMKVVTSARTVIVGLVRHYHEDFDLETIE